MANHETKKNDGFNSFEAFKDDGFNNFENTSEDFGNFSEAFPSTENEMQNKPKRNTIETQISKINNSKADTNAESKTEQLNLDGNAVASDEDGDFGDFADFSK